MYRTSTAKPPISSRERDGSTCCDHPNVSSDPNQDRSARLCLRPDGASSPRPSPLRLGCLPDLRDRRWRGGTPPRTRASTSPSFARSVPRSTRLLARDEPGDLTSARQQLAEFRQAWPTREPQAVHSFCWGIQRTLVFYQFAPALWPRIRTTNLIERRFRTFRTRADAIGAFPNATSCLGLFFMIARHEHAKLGRSFLANTS